MAAFAVEWLTKLFGSDVAAAVKKTSATRWNAAPFVLGAMSAATPGGQPSRNILTEPMGCMFLAAKRPTKPCGERSTAPGKAASAPLTRRCARSARSGIPNPARRRAPAAELAAAPRPHCRQTDVVADRLRGGFTPAASGASGSGVAREAHALTRQRQGREISAARNQARKLPPVFLVTSATILAATASISWSVRVFSRGWIVTAIATDFLPSSMPLPS